MSEHFVHLERVTVQIGGQQGTECVDCGLRFWNGHEFFRDPAVCLLCGVSIQRVPEAGQCPKTKTTTIDAAISGPTGAALQASPLDELREWWVALAEADFGVLAPKVTEYSAYDLSLIGRVMAEMIGFKEATDAIHQELGCFWYLLGKVGRMAGAYREGRLPADDSWHDSQVYPGMVRRIRAVGGWPHGMKETK